MTRRVGRGYPMRVRRVCCAPVSGAVGGGGEENGRTRAREHVSCGGHTGAPEERRRGGKQRRALQRKAHLRCGSPRAHAPVHLSCVAARAGLGGHGRLVLGNGKVEWTARVRGEQILLRRLRRKYVRTAGTWRGARVAAAAAPVYVLPFVVLFGPRLSSARLRGKARAPQTLPASSGCSSCGPRPVPLARGRAG